MSEPAENLLMPVGFDHYPRFLAFEQNVEIIAGLVAMTIEGAEPQDVVVDDHDGRLLLSVDEIGCLWGAFPRSARIRSKNVIPKIKALGPMWFSLETTASKRVATDKEEEAASPTSHALANTISLLDKNGSCVGTEIINVYEIPANGFSSRVKRLIQAGVILHELAHTVINAEMWHPDPSYSLLFLNGDRVTMRDWFWKFALKAEEYMPISRYSSAYRDHNNLFPRRQDCIVIGSGVNEELAESIVASLLGFIVTADGLTYEPFRGRTEMENETVSYLNASC